MATKIYIDQGHNPERPNAGAEAFGVKEQDINYEVGVILADLLRANGNFDVRLSRPTAESSIGSSNSESLQMRVSDANAWGADYFLSIHTNASENPQANGVEAFSYASGTPAFYLGESILRGRSAATGQNDRGMKVRPGLYVLRRTAMPAILLEIGFITNPREAALMNNDPDLFARGIYNGIVERLG